MHSINIECSDVNGVIIMMYIFISTAVSSGISSTHMMSDNKLSDEMVARMMNLDDFDDNNDAKMGSSKSRLRRMASSSSSSDSISESSSDELELPSTISHRSMSKSKLSKPSKTKTLEYSSGEEVTVRAKHSKTRKTSGGSRTSGKASQAPLEPVGIFWDIENCKVPNGRSAFYLAQKFRQHFVEGKREVEFMCVCDTLKETGEVINDLNKAHVSTMYSISV